MPDRFQKTAAEDVDAETIPQPIQLLVFVRTKLPMRGGTGDNFSSVAFGHMNRTNVIVS